MESTNVQYSGVIHLGSTDSSPARSRSAVAGDASMPLSSFVTASGRSPHFLSGMPMTAHSTTTSDSMMRFSTCAE